jgi:hypothetical protein
MRKVAVILEDDVMVYGFRTSGSLSEEGIRQAPHFCSRRKLNQNTTKNTNAIIWAMPLRIEERVLAVHVLQAKLILSGDSICLQMKIMESRNSPYTRARKKK